MTTTTPTTTTTPRSVQRAERIRAIVSAATVREQLGCWARYKPLPNGFHEITYRGRIYVGAELEATIQAAGEWRDER